MNAKGYLETPGSIKYFLFSVERRSKVLIPSMNDQTSRSLVE